MLHKKGDIVLDLRPGEGNPRNSEGAFLDLKDGRLLLIYSRFIGESSGDAGLACLAARYSGDDGETWSEDELIVRPEEHDAMNLMSVSLLRMLNGDIGLFYLIRYGLHDMRLHLRRSADEGKTWGEAVCCIPGPGYYVTNNDRVIRLASGRLVVPAAYHKVRGDSRTDWKSLDVRGVAHFYLSDDDGVTWREAKSYCVLPYSRTISGLQEPGVVELKNGSLWAWARTDVGCQYGMFSADGGETWSSPEPTPFSSPCSPLSLKRVPQTDVLLAVWNPIPHYQTREYTRISGGRTPLVGAISKDEGLTWTDFFAAELEEDRGGYCYTAIHFTRDAVLLAYCAGEPEDRSRLARLKVRKVSLSEIVPS
ncbi:exo-alpha-sialidase [Paenibacillus hemerocallicola]|uniref:Exo-alpha-sialidase n=1 Tax=Paenibacillus hemerocallicola TaxID=1172614 RepID=A0A5C4T4B9_9BACL|nr:sialidase family protein [Paenibacillus hemerocallicola]TNJ62999.1 exo-alpha-sialidase [Paenibacillus hemerocallicola]